MDTLSSRVHSDFNQARFQALLNRIWNILLGQPTELLSFDDIKSRLRFGGSVYRGIKTIKLKQIVGSLNRHHEFDRAFRPFRSVSPERWGSVNRAFYEGTGLPAIVLYKIDEVYFVVDGHHRVSVARKQGQVFIDAEVSEFNTGVKITTNVKMKDLELLCASLMS